MSNRYNREVAARAFRLASEATTTDDFAVPHLDHPPGTCIDCDAQRFLVNAAEIGISLHKIRRTLGGHGAERDPLQPPLLGSWCAAFPSTQAAEDAELTALQEDNGIVTPKFSDPDDHLSLERRISLHFEEIEAVRAQVEEWAANFDGEITHEEIRLFD